MKRPLPLVSPPEGEGPAVRFNSLKDIWGKDNWHIHAVLTKVKTAWRSMSWERGRRGERVGGALVWKRHAYWARGGAKAEAIVEAPMTNRGEATGCALVQIRASRQRIPTWPTGTGISHCKTKDGYTKINLETKWVIKCIHLKYWRFLWFLMWRYSYQITKQKSNAVCTWFIKY